MPKRKQKAEEWVVEAVVDVRELPPMEGKKRKRTEYLGALAGPFARSSHAVQAFPRTRGCIESVPRARSQSGFLPESVWR